MPHKIYRHKLLLDENFPHRTELKKSGISDEEVFEIAIKYKCILVTFDDRHFKEKSKSSKDTGVIGVSTNLSNEQIDKKLTSLLVKSGQKEFFGKFTYISGTSN